MHACLHARLLDCLIHLDSGGHLGTSWETLRNGTNAIDIRDISEAHLLVIWGSESERTSSKDGDS